MDDSTKRWILGGTIPAATVALALTRNYWWPGLNPHPSASAKPHDVAAAVGSVGPVARMPLSDQARENLGLKTGPIRYSDYWRTISVPGVVGEEPGHCERRITTSVAGIVLRVHALKGQTVHAGDALFDLQLTSELLATAQADLLKTLNSIEVSNQLIERLTQGVATGSTPESTLIREKNTRRQLENDRLLQMQELHVRGLSQEQIDNIVTTKKLLTEFTVRVPGDRNQQERHDVPSGNEAESTRSDSPADRVVEDLTLGHTHSDVYTVEDVQAQLGKTIRPGDELCKLARHTVLMVEGQAFERESPLINRALVEQWPMRVKFEWQDNQSLIRDGLKILYVDNTIKENTRTLRFYLPFRNEILRDSPSVNGVTYRTWMFKPGQKVSIEVPIELLKERIVVPADACVTEGIDAYVFRCNGRLMERVPVAIESQTSQVVVLKNDGSLYPGDEIALNQAYQLNLALRQTGEGGGGHDHDHDHDH